MKAKMFKILLSLLLTCAICSAQDVVTRYSPFMSGSAKPFLLTDWPSRVVAHGGALPSANSTNAVNIFYTHLVLTGLTNKLISVIGYAPDSLTAAFVPIYFQAGYSMWTNNFAGGDLTVNGVTGNTTTKFAQTGIFPASLSAGGFSDNSAGISLMVYSATNTSSAGRMFGGLAAGSKLWEVVYSGANIIYSSWRIEAGDVNAGWVVRPLPPPGTNWSGYMSGNRTAADAIRLDLVTNGVMGVYTNAIGTFGANTRSGLTNTSAHALFFQGAQLGWTDKTISFLAVHGGLTFTESSNLAVGVFQLRTNFGGGVPVPQ